MEKRRTLAGVCKISMKYLSICSGGGGGDYGMNLLHFQCLGFIENDESCQQLLAQRQLDGTFERCPIFRDIYTFVSDGYAASYQGMVDAVTAGFPCQPFSIAGKKQGEKDSRNLWPILFETICIIQPKYVFLENSTRLLGHQKQIELPSYYGVILGQLASIGYDVSWDCFSAKQFNSIQLRNRFWGLAIKES